jgi:tRNA (mo5U34)-methyltransferase
LKRRGAARVLAVDHDPAYLRQARFARKQLGIDVDFAQGDVYDIDRVVGGEQFDYVVFMGVLYHLRHPLYALEKVAGLVRGRLLFQSMERGSWDLSTVAADYPITERDVFFDQRFRACTSSSMPTPATTPTGGFQTQRALWPSCVVSV